MSSFFKPGKHKKAGFAIKPSDRLRESFNQLSSRASVTPDPITPPSTAANLAKPPRRSCPNEHCPDPFAPVQDGYCTACGREIDTSNIVAEVTFSEAANGAAIVQGTFVGADQGGVRAMGPGMRRIGGQMTNTREKTIREARQMMEQYAHQLKLSENIVNTGIQIFKLAMNENWIQGRGLIRVVPVCLYAACRQQERCRVMLIDFAELVKINVFELGHVFKALNDIWDFGHNNVKSIIPEDLMYRFCEKLDFGDFTKDVAETASKFCKRMGLDWMVMGRRPSGICGACILMAAQIWGFRRTVREVVYVVKVTMATIEQRLDEFKEVESADMTIEDFLKQELLESRHDPPSFYKKQSEWQEKLEKQRQEHPRKRRRIEDFEDPEEEERRKRQSTSESTQFQSPVPDGNQTSTTAQPSTAPATESQEMPPPPLPLPDMSKYRQVAEFLPKSVDPTTGQTAIEAFDPDNVPEPAPKVRDDKDVAEGIDAEDPTGEEAMEHLAETYADEDSKKPKNRRGRRGRRAPVEPLLNFDEEWEHDEAVLEKQIEEVIADPHSDEHRKALATAAQIARIKAAWARSLLPRTAPISEEEIIDESEFADDPEVQNCMLSQDEIAIKEMIWLNANKDWLRKQQDKEFRKEMEKLGPKKKRRNRMKKPRVGEGQLTPASTPGEAAAAAMKKFTLSKRINLDAIRNMFAGPTKGPGSVAQSSRADSEVADEPETERPAQDGAPEGREDAGDDEVAEEDYEDQWRQEEVYDEDGNEGFDDEDYD